jgi:regulator of replication initiation timing
MKKETKSQLKEYLYWLVRENESLEKEIKKLKEKLKKYETT